MRCRRELGIAPDVRVQLYSGNMGEKQGLDVLIEVARQQVSDQAGGQHDDRKRQVEKEQRDEPGDGQRPGDVAFQCSPANTKPLRQLLPS